MSFVLHVGHWQYWLGIEPRFPWRMHAGRSLEGEDWSLGFTVEFY